MLLILAPGPDNLYVIATASRQGLRSALWLTAGLCSGLFFHTLAVILGLAILIKSNPLAFTLIKIAGATYLVYLAWRMLRDAPSPLVDNRQSVAPGSVAYFVRGVIMNVSNPKVGVFFLAFLPQFVSDEYTLPISMQILILGVIFQLLALVIFSALAWLAHHGSLQGKLSAKTRQRFNWTVAGLFIVLAIRLVFMGIS